MLVNYKKWLSPQVYPKYFRERNTTIGTVIKDKNVETTTVLAILSMIFFDEYILAIK